jgi:DoxX-like family
MFPAHVALVIMLSLLAVLSAVAKLRHDPKVVRIINEVVRVPLKWFPWLAACEFAGAAGLLRGLAWRPIGIAAAAGLLIYFVGAVVAHVRVGDVKGIGTPAVPLLLAAACLVTGILTVG